MEESLKNKLDAMLAHDRSVKEKSQAVEKQARDKREEFIELFKTHRESVLKPAIQEFADYISTNGWTAKISTNDPHVEAGIVRSVSSSGYSIKADFFRGSSSYSGSSVPFVSFNCAANEQKISIHSSTIGTNHGGSSGTMGSFSIGELDHSAVQRELTTYFAKLLEASRPYS
ncbi:MULTISPECIES: hypothetical protein [unclassified Rhizobium]|uniref:hypothetical protein n=1 Tax=unclassified Rhizobium TaxID=2613769 RepID=UPI00177FB204|nr:MULTISPECIES: hypothetical protein [unclassified Rhizobium]MBD8687055.1 hypothetical protein [Rhizobium sp. CFBP 13644]MBD8691142.1 hypothetical protein [Rhizobium sp. CFBP 13717]